jgi:hypothetical protein
MRSIGIPTFRRIQNNLTNFLPEKGKLCRKTVAKIRR